MKRKLRPSPAMIVAAIALITALGGTAVAANVITTKAFKKQAVRGPIVYVTSTVSVPNTGGNPATRATATCPTGTHVIGGGAKVEDLVNMTVDDGFATATGWTTSFYNGNASAKTGTVEAICATVKRVTGTAPLS